MGMIRRTVSIDTGVDKKIRQIQSRVLSEAETYTSFSKLENIILFAGLLSLHKLDPEDMRVLRSVIEKQSVAIDSKMQEDGVSKLLQLYKKELAYPSR